MEFCGKKVKKSESFKPKSKPNGKGDKDKFTKNDYGKTQIVRAKLDKNERKWRKKGQWNASFVKVYIL